MGPNGLDQLSRPVFGGRGTPRRLYGSRGQYTLLQATQKENSVERTSNNALLPHAVLIVHQTVSLNVVAMADKVVHHALNFLLRDKALGSLRALLEQVLLLLKDTQPRMVEVVPQLDPVGVKTLVVRGQACLARSQGQFTLSSVGVALVVEAEYTWHTYRDRSRY